MDRWDDLRIFLTVARNGTLTAAGEALSLNVSTVHRRLAAFEAALGTPVFDKGPRGYRLTPAGEALLSRAEVVEEGVFAATRAVVGHDQQASGDVRLTLPLVLLAPLAPHLAAFSRACPRIRLFVQADDVSLDLDRETDLALRATAQPVDSAVGRNLCGLAWGLYAPVGTEGDDLPWIHYVGMDQAPAERWRREHHPGARPIMCVHSVSGMLAMLAAAGAQGLLPCFAGDADPQLRRVGAPVAMNQLWLLIHADLRRSARVRALIDFLVPRIQADRARFEGG